MIPSLHFAGSSSTQPKSPKKPFFQQFQALPPEIREQILPRQDLFQLIQQPNSTKERPLVSHDRLIHYLTRGSFDPQSSIHAKQNNEFLQTSLRNGWHKVFAPLLRTTAEPELGPLFEIAAIRNDKAASKKLFDTATSKKLHTPISEKTIEFLAACGKPKQVQQLLKLSSPATQEKARTFSHLAQQQKEKIDQFKKLSLKKLVPGKKNRELKKLLTNPAETPEQKVQTTRKAIALIKAGADIHKANNYGYTPLHEAAGNGHGDIVNALIHAGVDIHKADIFGETPLREAVGNGHGDIVNALIQAGADVNKANTYGYTPLHWAASNGHGDIVNALIHAKADVNKTTNTYGSTPLRWAAINGHGDIAQLLRDHGATE